MAFVTTTINHGKTRRNFNLVDRIESSTLKPQDKTELLINLTGKRKTMLEGAVFMLKNAAIKFDDFERALALLNGAENASSLELVESALQKQIDVIRRMSDDDLTSENKSLCLYTLQNMIFALSDFRLGKNQVNDFVPKILQDQYQMLMKGSALNMDWDSLNESTYSTEYSDFNNPTLAQWKFLDTILIQRNLENMAGSQTGADNTTNFELNAVQKKTTVQVNNDGTVSWGVFELKTATDEQINNLLNGALAKFDATDLKQNLLAIFNLVDASNQSGSTADNNVLHKTVLASMQRIVEIGSNQQKKTLLSENNQTTSNLDLMFFDLGESNGGAQMIFLHRPINEHEDYVLTLGNVQDLASQNQAVSVTAPDKNLGKQLLNNLRKKIPGLNQNQTEPQTAESKIKLRCFKLSRVEDSKYQIEEYVTLQSIGGAVQTFIAG